MVFSSLVAKEFANKIIPAKTDTNPLTPIIFQICLPNSKNNLFSKLLVNPIEINFLRFYINIIAIESILNSGFTNNIYRYEESEVFNNYENFLNEIFNKSFFEDRKIIIISRVSEKIYSLIDEVRNKEIKDVKIIINSNSLDKRSKLRSNFEKENDLVCIPFYNDDNSTLVKNSITNICTNSWSYF